MNKPVLLFITAAVLFLIACNLIGSLAQNATPTTLPEQPTMGTPTPTPTTLPPTTLPATATPTVQPRELILYYYFVDTEVKSLPAKSVVILPDILVLAPVQAAIYRGPDISVNLQAALQEVLDDPSNAWTSTGLEINKITFKEGAVEAVLQGEYFGAGDIVLMAARAQILLTVFAEPAVQTAAITLNGDNIANLGISHSSEARPADYAYTRAEIEAFIAENVYKGP
jgi:spore germination protein GerM